MLCLNTQPSGAHVKPATFAYACLRAMLSEDKTHPHAQRACQLALSCCACTRTVGATVMPRAFLSPFWAQSESPGRLPLALVD